MVEPTPQEAELLEAIRLEPFIGRKELAERFGMARGTVSSHIRNLHRKALILGRAYVLSEEEPRITCAGAVNVDRIMRLDEAALLGTSNSGTTTTSPGGVARNVAEHLAGNCVTTSLFGAVGDDEDGRFLLNHAAAAGIDVAGVATVQQPTGSYTAVIDSNGSLVIGVADTTATAAISDQQIVAIRSRVASSAWLFLDTNLTLPVLETLTQLSTISQCRVAINAVSVAMAPLAKGLPVDLLFCAREEAEAIVGKPLTNHSEATDALMSMGFTAAVVILDAGGTWYYDESGKSGHIPVPPGPVTDMTGTRDALMAETLRRLMDDETLTGAVSAGIKVAAQIAQHVGATYTE